MSAMSSAHTLAEKVEIALIPLVGIAVCLIAAWLPNHLSIASLLLGASILLLLQGLIRDLWLISKHTRQAEAAPPHQALCMCVESSVGIAGIVAGLMILGSAIDLQLFVHPWIWSVFAVAILAIGFAIKDFIFEWRPFRIRRDKDHVNIVFRRKK